nr:RNA-directed DNA polymerase, eukaryota, reverse transcriptase zinc-binding domain protein [Tanacetum cinerariifolium]
DLRNDLKAIDLDFERGNVSDDTLLKRMELKRRLHDINLMEANELAQKSKIKWAIEGDENTNFFHGIINKKRSQLSICGIFVDGSWCTDLSTVKEKFKYHFEARFQQPCHDRFNLNAPLQKCLSFDQVEELDRDVSRDEIRRAVWSCGANKSPGPDGYTFEFFRKYWSFIGPDLPISLIGSVYKVITKILANRLAMVLNWCKRKRKQALFFKVDFAKAYDSVRWDYLLDILQAFGFRPNWCRWIRGTFTSAMASILVNGSPTLEFPLCCSLKQGDPLAPYLFILIMESLHLSFSRVVNDGLFKGEWSELNLHTIINVLICFHLACDVLHTLFWYLGVTVGDTMSRKSAWVGLVKTFSIGGRLTLLKSVLGASPIYFMSIFKVPKGMLKTLESIQSNFFNGSDSSERKIPWVAWDSVLASKEKDDLGVSSFFALDRALLVKWVWRFISGDNSLWRKVIQAIYGPNLDSHVTDHSSTWCSILHEVNSLKDIGFDFNSHCKMRIRDGSGTRFWFYPWLSDVPLYVRFPCLFALELDRESVVADKLGASSVSGSFRRDVRDGAERQQWDDLSYLIRLVILSPSKDRWTCDMSGDGEFKVKDVRNCIDDLIHPSLNVATRWSKSIPIKVNVFTWRARRDRLPTKTNLCRRGVLLDSSLCPICNVEFEDIHHVLFQCDVARAVFRRICRWWDLDWQEIRSFLEWDALFLAIRLPSRLKAVLEGVFCAAWWMIWSLQNMLIFDPSPPSRSGLFDDIVSWSFLWCSSRCNRAFFRSFG